MNLYFRSACWLYFSCLSRSAAAQSPADTLVPSSKQAIYKEYAHQRDVIDLGMWLFKKDPATRLDRLQQDHQALKISVGPILEYTLATKFTGGLAANAAFFTGNVQRTNVSSVLMAVKYTQRKQFLLPVQTSIWLPGNQYFLAGDWRYLNFPQDTYGFGGETTIADLYTINYKYIRFYQLVYRHIRSFFYAGAGYQLDHHWNISEENVPAGDVTDYTKYGFSKSSTSSGLTISLIYDSRKNSINPAGGSNYGNIQFLHNASFLGSNQNSNTVIIDLRKYFAVGKKNVLAFWSYNVFTLSGNPPYLDLPGTGNDPYNNTGRGYEQGRFIGKNMVDLEAEFRFGITSNGLVGGVVFANAESLSELQHQEFSAISPGFGIGLRIKFNKFSGTNACIDYGIGKEGSHGFFGNLGEVF